MPRPARRRRLHSSLPEWWQQRDPPWWARLGVGVVIYAGYLFVDSNRFDADELRQILAVLVLGGLGMKK